ncbi:hypothetical protein F5984_20595 [Rudanella paleaurantiibacter]|uniref:Uncharacterized protein n=1 Tax=Rudanella paleaurantiibacter TaxID=2614655 RepID=A0A7J5TVN6_9BACT|nr:hypothetical protein [Rudanella paleaurantiibacter]KAB7728147.1 hypothetical protein F5984_20595 [Rudanella paleaurantiibacter]
MLDVRNQIRKASDADLLTDQRSYQNAIAQDRMPEMRQVWRSTLALIDEEIELRAAHARAVSQWRLPVELPDAPF